MGGYTPCPLGQRSRAPFHVFFPTWPLRVGSPPPDGRAQGARACAHVNRVLVDALQACFRHLLQSAWRFARSHAPRTRLWPLEGVRLSQCAYGPRQGACALPCFTFAAEHAAPELGLVPSARLTGQG